MSGRSSNPPPYIKSPPFSPGAGSLFNASQAGKIRFSLGRLLLIFFLAGLILTAIALWLSVPDVSDLKTHNPKDTAFMRFRRAQEGGRRIPNLSWTSLSRMSPWLIQAVLIAEDDKFFSHEGFDWQSMRDAMESNLKKKRVRRGGSTITQQLAKNLFLTPSRSLIRKVREMAIAVALEKELSKKRILELYLNAAEWGSNVFGITAASRHYFASDPATLSLSQSIRLASVLPNPIRFHVLDNDSKRMNRKRKTIVQRMYQRNWILESERDQALKELGLA